MTCVRTDEERERRTEEAGARRMAARRGYRIEKSRRRDPKARDFGRWAIFDAVTGRLLSPENRAARSQHSLSLGDVFRWMDGDE